MKIGLLAVSALILICPLVINIFGKSVFLYINGAEKVTVVGASHGSLHLARTSTPMSEPDTVDIEEFSEYSDMDIGHTRWLKFGLMELFAENRLSSMRYLHFGYNPGSSKDDYSSIEFPLILLLLAPLGFLCIAIGQSRNVAEQVAASDR